MLHLRWILAMTAAFAVAAAAGGTDDGSDVASTPTPVPATAAPAEGWESVAPPPLTTRAHSVGVWTGEEVLIVGGDTFMCPPGADCTAPTDPPLSDGVAFDPRAGTWRAIAPAPVGFSSAATAVVGDDVYFWARVGAGAPDASPAFLRYSVVDDAWARLPLPEPAHPWYGVVAAGEVIVAYSGSDEYGEQPDLVFDPVAEEWDTLPADPLGPAFDRTLVWSSPYLYLFDHELVPNPGSERPSLTRAARLDLATGVWDRLPDSEILGTGPWFVEDGRLVNPTLGTADGGEVNNWGRSYPEGGIFDTVTSRWIPLPAAPDEARSAGALGSRDALYLATDGVLLDLASEAWIELPALPEDGDLTERAVISAGPDAFVFGGVRWTEMRGELLGDAWIRRSGRGVDPLPSGTPGPTSAP